jgi:hypothetical protein
MVSEEGGESEGSSRQHPQLYRGSHDVSHNQRTSSILSVQRGIVEIRIGATNQSHKASTNSCPQHMYTLTLTLANTKISTTLIIVHQPFPPSKSTIQPFKLYVTRPPPRMDYL